MIDTVALQSKIIDLAIQGKLTEQLPTDGNAEDLYQQIQAEKAQLIKDKKIKKTKPLPEITAEEIPFEIPANWKWVRIGDVTYNYGQKTPENRFCYIDVGTLDNINNRLNGENNVIEAKDAPSRAKKIVSKGDVIYSTVRPYLHNICIVDRDFPYEPIASTAFAVMKVIDGCIINKYLFYWLLSECFDKYANGDSSKGTLYPAIGEKDFFNGIISLPPLSEQKRIVAKVDEVLAEIKIIDELQSQYASNVEVLKSKIIDAGIRGQLTEQLPEDSTAEELYQQIQAEKAQLIKDKKIKKEKPLPEITADEIPFEIPANWKWVRLRDIVQIINGDRGKNYPAKSTLSHEGIPFISALNLNGDGITEDDRLLCLTDEQYNRLGSGKLERNDIVICIRGSIGKHGRYPYDKGAIASSLVICRPYIYLDEIGCFIMKWLKSYLFVNEIGKYDGGSAQPNLAADNLKKFLVPLPPLSEQKRIVAKINDVFGALDERDRL